MAAMRSWIDYSGEVVWDPAPSLVVQLIEAGQPFWLDIENPTDELAARLGLHPLAAEDSKQFGQRAKLQVYGNGAMLVGFGLFSRSWLTSPRSKSDARPSWSCTHRSRVSIWRS
jgi:hypothetical protein